MILSLIDVCYKQTTFALEHLDLQIEKNGFYLLTGSSGSGKTTLLHLIGGLITPASGEVLIHQHSYANKKTYNAKTLYQKEIGFIFQNSFFMDQYSVYTNLRQFGFGKDEIHEALRKVGLDHLLKQKAGSLSLGQKQRLALALIVLTKPSIILCDEPTASLDKDQALMCINMLQEFSRHAVVIVASHQLHLYEDKADSILYLKDGSLQREDKRKTDCLDTYQGRSISFSLWYQLRLALYHIHTYLFSYIKMILILLLGGMLFFMLINIQSSFKQLIVDFPGEYPNLYVLEVENTSQEEIEECLGDMTILSSKQSYQSYAVSIATQDVSMYSGSMPKNNEACISRDLEEEYAIDSTIMIQDQEFTVSGIIDNTFITDTVYINKNDYMNLLYEGQGYVILFNSYDKLVEAKEKLEKEYYAVCTNDYYDFTINSSEVVDQLLLYLQMILVFVAVFFILLFILIESNLLSHLKKEVVLFSIHGFRLIEMAWLYAKEWLGIILAGILITFSILPFAFEYLDTLFYENFISIHFLSSFSDFILSQGIYVLAFLLIEAIAGILVIGIITKREFREEIGMIIKGEEGC